MTRGCAQLVIGGPLLEDTYTGIVEAVLATKDHEDCYEYDNVAHTGLSVINSPPLVLPLDCENTEYKGAMDHYLS